jgi:hypothetical protein
MTQPRRAKLSNVVRLVFATYAAGVALSTMVSLRSQAEFYRTHAHRPARICRLVRPPRLSRPVFRTAGLAFVFALLMAAVGIAARYFAFLAIMLYFLYFSQILQLSYIGRKTNLIPIVLMILLCAPGVTAPFSTAPPVWPVLAAQAVVACVYMSAGLAKLRNTGLRWASGIQLQAYLFSNYLWRDSELTWRVAKSRRLCAAASCGTLFIELFFPLAIVSRLLALFFVTAAIILHFSTHVTMGVNYLRYWWPNFLPFIIPAIVLSVR